MSARTTTVLIAALLCVAPVASQAALSPYLGTFEGMDIGEIGVPNSLSVDGWLVFGNVSNGPTYLYGYGPYPAPNDGAAFCGVTSGQGGDLQGANQLSVYSDYNNQGAQTAGYLVEANTYREQDIGAADVGDTWTFQFDAKLGNLAGTSTALAFIKTLDPNQGWATTNYVTVNTTAIPATWNTYSISLPIDASLVNQKFQIGFANTTTLNQPTGVFYDNVVLKRTAGAAVGDGPLAALVALSAAAPNPFRGATRFDFTLPRPDAVDLAVFDVAGRRVATLFHGPADAGVHASTWDGRTAEGGLAASGVYRCVLQTSAGRVTRGLVLAR